MYDLTTLHFEASNEDRLRKAGMSKERRVDPQVTVGLLVTAGGFPLEIALFEGNKAETKTLTPVIEQFRSRHGMNELVVVADGGMLSADNLNGLEDAGSSSRPASRTCPMTWATPSNATATTPLTIRRSRPRATWATGSSTVPAEWCITTPSSATSETTRPSTPRSSRPRRSLTGSAPSPGTGS